MVAEPGHVVIVEPHPMRHGEMRAEHAERIEMRCLGAAVKADAGHRLHLRLGDMAVQPDIELARQIGAAEDEPVRAMVRDRRRDRRAHQVAVERPAGERGADRRQGRLGRRQAQFGDPRLQRRRHRLDQAGDRLVEAAVGDHRRHHRAHADIGIGLSGERQTLGGRQRPFERKIIAGGAALHDHLDGAELGRQVTVVEAAVAGDPGRRGQQQFERPAVAHSLGEVAVAMGMGVDEAGVEQPARRRDLDCPLGRGAAGRADLADRVALDQDVGEFGGAGGDIEHPAAAQDRVGHAIVSAKRTT